jgi:hypothetical protein
LQVSPLCCPLFGPDNCPGNTTAPPPTATYNLVSIDTRALPESLTFRNQSAVAPVVVTGGSAVIELPAGGGISFSFKYDPLPSSGTHLAGNAVFTARSSVGDSIFVTGMLAGLVKGDTLTVSFLGTLATQWGATQWRYLRVP